MSDLVPQNEQKKVVEFSRLPEDAQNRARDIATQINVEDSNAVVQYGVGAQGNISSFADTILNEIRNKDSGYVGEVLSGLVERIRDVDVGGLSGDAGFLGKLFGGIKRRIQAFIARYEKLSTQIDRIVNELETARMNLLRDITLLDNLYEKNAGYLQDLDIYIAAGQIKVQELREVKLPELQKKAEESNDPLDAQRLQDFNQLINRFEKKLHDLLLSRMISIQTSPQIRLVQNNNQTLVEKIQSSIMNTIPLWKNQIIIAISLFRQKKALEIQREVSDTTNELLAKNSAMLKETSLGVARESERGIVEIETLKKVNDDLISTIEETLRIQDEGRQKRAAAEQELVKLEGELKTRLKHVNTAS